LTTRQPFGAAAENPMKKLICLLLVASGLVSGCVYVGGDHPRGGYGNNFCPPGQAKKGNC
jgi:hypothetical protein